MKHQKYPDQKYHDFRQQLPYEPTSKMAFHRDSADLKKVDQPEILGDIMKADWNTEGDSNVICD